MKLRPLLPVLGAALAFSSCTYCNIGGYIGNSFTTYTGVDVDHPVDGKVYRVGDGKQPAYYMLAPEITFSPCRYTMDPATKQPTRVETDKVREKDTTLEELPYLVDKNKPCVLVLKSRSLGFAPSRKLRKDLANLLESQGLRLQGFIISHHPAMDNYSYLPLDVRAEASVP